MRRRLTKIESYPGIDNRFVICDVCGKKFRVKDTTRIIDRYNLLNNMIVCFADADKANPQIKPKHIQEELLTRKDYVRPEATYFKYAREGSILPSAPTNLTVNIDQFSGALLLNWYGPRDTGDSPVIGYRIYRNDDAYIGQFDIIVDNTRSLATIFLDYSAATEGVNYTYTVSIITLAGESPQSDYAYWPAPVDVDYLTTSQDDSWLLCSQDNKRIVLMQIPVYNIVLTQNNSQLATTQLRDLLIL